MSKRRKNPLNFPRRKAANKAAELERSKYRSELSPTQQLKRLDARLGAGVGAVKERKRLQAKIAG
jgi:hypothetical protein